MYTDTHFARACAGEMHVEINSVTSEQKNSVTSEQKNSVTSERFTGRERYEFGNMDRHGCKEKFNSSNKDASTT